MVYATVDLLVSKGEKFATKEKSSIYLIGAGIPEIKSIYRNCPLRHPDVNGDINIPVFEAINQMGKPKTYAIFEKACDSGDYELRAIVKNDEYIESGQLTVDILEMIFDGKEIDSEPLTTDKLNELVTAYNEVRD